jgi:hypothetical protein
MKDFKLTKIVEFAESRIHQLSIFNFNGRHFSLFWSSCLQLDPAVSLQSKGMHHDTL